MQKKREKKRAAGSLIAALMLCVSGGMMFSGCKSTGGSSAVAGEEIICETAAADAAAPGAMAPAPMAPAAGSGLGGDSGEYEALMQEAGFSEDTNAAGQRTEYAGTEAQEQGMPVTERKLIKDVNLIAETQEYDALLSAIEAEVEALSGYIERRNSSVPRIGAQNEVRSTFLTVRIPADKVDLFLDSALRKANIIHRNETVTDITLQYIDLSAKKEALSVEQERLMELLAKADSAESLIVLEERLSEIRYELQSLASQLRSFDNQVSYSTVSMEISEVSTLSAASGDSFFTKLSAGLRRNTEVLGRFFSDTALFVLTGLPILLVVAGIAVFVYSICKRFRRGRHKEEKTRHADDKEGKTELHS